MLPSENRSACTTVTYRRRVETSSMAGDKVEASQRVEKQNWSDPDEASNQTPPVALREEPRPRSVKKSQRKQGYWCPQGKLVRVKRGEFATLEFSPERRVGCRKAETASGVLLVELAVAQIWKRGSWTQAGILRCASRPE